MQLHESLQLISQPRVQELFGVSAMTLWRWQKQTDFPEAKVIRGRKYFRASEIRAWIDAQQDACLRVIPSADIGRKKGRATLSAA
jgi:predicted DNA-binding transcriptional regulator AlpA